MKGNSNNSCMGRYKDTLDIKLINECNGSCPFCIESNGRQSIPADVDDLIKKVNDINPKSVLVLGGEPFLHPRLIDFIRGISGRDIYITTNGSILKDRHLIDKLGGYIKGLNISLHHYSFVKHKELTGVKPEAVDVRTAISILNSHGVPTRINTVIIKNYLDTLEECEIMIEFAHWLGANSIRFSEVQDCPDLFIDAKTIFSGLYDNPYIDGCEQLLHNNFLDVYVKQTCSLVNKAKTDCVPSDAIGCGSGGSGGCNINKQGVLYPDLFHSKSGWITVNSNGCHGVGDGCH